jgi:hypothetical protein
MPKLDQRRSKEIWSIGMLTPFSSVVYGAIVGFGELELEFVGIEDVLITLSVLQVYEERVDYMSSVLLSKLFFVF